MLGRGVLFPLKEVPGRTGLRSPKKNLMIARVLKVCSNSSSHHVRFYAVVDRSF